MDSLILEYIIPIIAIVESVVIAILTFKTDKLKEEIFRLRRENDTLTGQVETLQATKDTLIKNFLMLYSTVQTLTSKIYNQQI